MNKIKLANTIALSTLFGQSGILFIEKSPWRAYVVVFLYSKEFYLKFSKFLRK